MSDLAYGPFRDDPEARRFQQTVSASGHAHGLVFADYAVRGAVRVILHVEADARLRGTGAAGAFMQALVDHCRDHDLQLHPVCGYAVAWLKRHPETADLIA